MSKISVLAKLTAADGAADRLEAALASLVEAADEEAGLEVYSAHRADDDPNTYWFFEVYADADAIAAHGKGDAMKAAMAEVGRHLAGRPEVTRLKPVVAKGLDI